LPWVYRKTKSTLCKRSLSPSGGLSKGPLVIAKGAAKPSPRTGSTPCLTPVTVSGAHGGCKPDKCPRTPWVISLTPSPIPTPRHRERPNRLARVRSPPGPCCTSFDLKSLLPRPPGPVERDAEQPVSGSPGRSTAGKSSSPTPDPPGALRSMSWVAPRSSGGPRQNKLSMPYKLLGCPELMFKVGSGV